METFDDSGDMFLLKTIFSETEPFFLGPNFRSQNSPKIGKSLETEMSLTGQRSFEWRHLIPIDMFFIREQRHGDKNATF